MRQIRRQEGFTILELLIALVIMSISLVWIFPIVLAQLDWLQYGRAASDLSAFRTGIAVFGANTNAQPRYLEHLAHPIDTGKRAVDNPLYTAAEVRRWNGPYIDQQIAAGLTTGDAFRILTNARVRNRVLCYNPATNSTSDFTCRAGTQLAVIVDSLNLGRFEKLNDAVDGTEEADGTESRLKGRLRAPGATGINTSSTVVVTYVLFGPYLVR